jgi:hypothetical protein
MTSKMSSASIETEDQPAQPPPQPGQSYSYEGEQVTMVREATFNDMGYKQGGGDQYLVQFEDGHQQVVDKAALEGNGSSGSSHKSSSRTYPKPEAKEKRE